MALLTSKCFAVWWLWHLSLLRGMVLCSVDDISGRIFVSFFGGGHPAPRGRKKVSDYFLSFAPNYFQLAALQLY